MQTVALNPGSTSFRIGGGEGVWVVAPPPLELKKDRKKINETKNRRKEKKETVKLYCFL